MHNSCDLTVIIPAFDRQEKTTRAVASIISQNMPCEIVIVDDVSEPPLAFDGLHEGQCSIRIIRRKTNGGAGAARNTGIREAKGKYVTFLDSDDYLLDNTLSERLAFIKKLKAASTQAPQVPLSVCCGWLQYGVDNSVAFSRLPRPANARADFFTGCWFSPGSTLICEKRLFTESIGMFDENLRRLEDLDWFIRFGIAGGELSIQDLDAAAIEVDRNKNIKDIMTAGAKLLQKYHRELATGHIAKPEFQNLKAYIFLEYAAANWHGKNHLVAMKYLLKSFIAYPRVKLHISPGWKQCKPH